MEGYPLRTEMHNIARVDNKKSFIAFFFQYWGKSALSDIKLRFLIGISAGRIFRSIVVNTALIFFFTTST